LRGVNAAGDSKVPDFRPLTDGGVFDPLARWGLNVVRLLFTWEAYEPEMGQYDDSYMNYYITAVQAAESNGLYVIVDFHQDGFSRWLPPGCGEGFPKWAIPPSVTPGQPDNGADCAKWALSSNGLDQRTASWSAFYSDSNGAQTAYSTMLSRVVSALSKEPMVLGYDLLNEPDGDEVTQIGPLYEAAAKVVRAADPTAILFLSPRAITGAGCRVICPRPASPMSPTRRTTTIPASTCFTATAAGRPTTRSCT
jgi:endoglycosylceramidase